MGEKCLRCGTYTCGSRWKTTCVLGREVVALTEETELCLRHQLASLRARVEELEALKERVVLWAQDAYIDPDSGPDECRGAGCYLTDETCRELVAILAGGGKEGDDA